MANEKKKSVVTRIIDNIREDAAAQHEIDKTNFAAVKEDTKARFDEATAPNPDFEEFKEAKGLKGKAAVVGRHIERDGKNMRAQSRENYEEMLRQQREHINELTRTDKS